MLKTTSFKLSWAMACTPEDLILKQKTQTKALTMTVITMLSIPARGSKVVMGMCCSLDIDSNRTWRKEPIMNTLKMITPSGSKRCFPTGYLNLVLSSLWPAQRVVPYMIKLDNKSSTDSTNDANNETLSERRTAAPFAPSRRMLMIKLTLSY